GNPPTPQTGGGGGASGRAAPAPPPADLVEQWRADRNANRDILDDPRFLRGVTTLPGAERGVLMQPQGRTWRAVHNRAVFYGGALYVVGVTLLLALFLAIRGPIRTAEAPSGETNTGVSAPQRANHWSPGRTVLVAACTGARFRY